MDDEPAAVVATFRDSPVEAAEPSPMRRLLEPDYADGLAEPRASEADAQAIAFQVFTQGDRDMPSEAGLSALWIFWGQFLDHDLDLTPEQEGETAELLKQDPPFDILRSEIAPGTGESDVPAEQMNAITPLIDASNVYGSDGFRTLLLRSFDGGRLQSQPGPDGVDLVADEQQLFIPFLDLADVPEYNGELEGFAAGDTRVSENAGLSAMHSLWVNEHNHWADLLAVRNPDWTDDEIFLNARAIVETLVQQITYEAFLPLLIGDALPAYAGFDPEVDPQISNEFATAAYRFGHTSIPDAFTLVAEDGRETGPAIPLFEAFENDAVLLTEGLPDMLRGLLEERAQEIDAVVVDSLNLFLFTPDGGLTGFSLPERNILRGRDHGLPTWAEARAELVGDIDPSAVGASTDFSLITSDADVAAALASVYETVGDVDLWVGGLAEDDAPGSEVGPTFTAILAEQFAATRDGDPLFYLAREWLDPALESAVRATTLADVLMRSGGVEHVQAEAFLASDRQGGTNGRDHLKGDEGRDLLIGLNGNDYLKGGAGDDDLFGDMGFDLLRGGTGDDGLTGATGHDSLMGGAGEDRLAGGHGNDLLVGGAGADVFVFEAGERGIDSLMDFEDGTDRIELRGYGTFESLEIGIGPFFSAIHVDGVAVVKVMGPDHMWIDESDIDLIG